MQELESQSISVKLYEFDYDKPDLSEETLEHHGILGMHWGQRNGPPYPLDSSKSTGKRLKSGKTPSKHKARKLKRKRVKSLKKARKIREQNRKVAQETQKTKEDIIKTKDIGQMLKDVDKFSNQEINDMLTRLDTEQRLRDRVNKQNEANRSPGRKFMDSAKSSAKKGVEKGTDSLISTVTENALKIGVKKLVSEAGGTNEDAQKVIDQLFKEKKK